MLLVDFHVPHPVGFDVERDRPAVGGEVEVIRGQVFAGVGIVATAVPLRGAVHVAGQQLIGALEHQVFEVVRQARLIFFFIARTDFVRHHRRDDRRAFDGQQVHLQTVRQRLAANVLEQVFRRDDETRRLGGRNRYREENSHEQRRVGRETSLHFASLKTIREREVFSTVAPIGTIVTTRIVRKFATRRFDVEFAGRNETNRAMVRPVRSRSIVPTD